jgi:hypothetical protein
VAATTGRSLVIPQLGEENANRAIACVPPVSKVAQ